ncbi:TPA: hypothetical protein DE059_01695 [Candidatus Peribacteria bacterium]|jgi:chorismate mutase|nr:hypothetical protein [Candidatus Peribacteria bacterium]|tara:strand:- start:6073 stop:6321 length:249 start_codon:yes stop_codon:yes gene_type:complete
MLTMTDTRSKVQKIDQQLIKLLSDRKQICEDARRLGEGVLIRELEIEQISNIIEEGVEQEMDETQLDRLASVVIRLCKGGEE